MVAIIIITLVAAGELGTLIIFGYPGPTRKPSWRFLCELWATCWQSGMMVMKER